jgi:hypothetical protein
MFAYAPEALEVLARHGLAPHAETPPQMVRDALSDLYRYEIRALKARLLANEFPKAQYIDRVIDLRKRYWLLSVPMTHWMRETA